ncbi:hypothetical protein CKF54_07840 [Psittacicella hinzii]|uniref:Aspartate-semialdehyde dehydrogenase n=1 Tax=Psittacicella hinzii TaxID=2028575 RepID=A0A3A1Y0V3_9GAMM|nr:hypothetical protein [Psittacicella hinzii]RIY31070.1 hypothetical protein CKF54_07840 [Psittacicella hinzii]
MGLHIAISAEETFITKFLSLAEQLHDDITRLTIVENSNADEFNFDDLDVIERFNYDYKKFANVDWDTVDLYLYNDNLENLKFLTGAASKSVFSVDLTGYSATLDQMPVVVPRVDEVQLEEIIEKKMASLPHPQVSQLMYIINSLRNNQPMLYVSVNNVFPVTYINRDAATTLAKQTRDFFNLTNSEDSKLSLAFDINALTDVAPDKQINFEAQIQRLMPQIETVHVNNLVAPVFYGTTQTVSVGLTTGNTIDTGIVEEWLGDVKDFEGIAYKVNQSSPKRYTAEDEGLSLLEFSDVVTAENVKWKSVCDNEQLILLQTIELVNLFIDNNLFRPM